MTPSHTKGPFMAEGLTSESFSYRLFAGNREIAVLTRHVGQRPKEARMFQESSDVSLLARFDEVPHTCTDATCPGMVNLRKLEAFEGLYQAGRKALEQIARHRCKYHGPMTCDKCNAQKALLNALAKAEGREI